MSHRDSDLAPQRLQAYLDSARQASMTAPLGTFLLAWISLPECGPLNALLWLALMTLADGATLIHTELYRRRPPSADAVDGWVRRQIAIHALTGVCWGLSVILLHSDQTIHVQFGDVHLVWLVATTAVSTGSMSVFASTLPLLLAGVWLPTLVLLVAHGTLADYQLVLAIVVLSAIELQYAASLRGQILRTLRRERDHATVSRELAAARSALEAANAQLVVRNASIADALERATDVATRDALTALYNRRFLDARLLDAHAVSARHGTVASLLFIDIDHFKHVNDTWGHGVGDAVLVALGRLLMRALRASDVVGRWGGEEFAVLLRHTDLAGAVRAAENLRASLAREPLAVVEGVPVQVTVSIGIAELRPGESVAEWIQRADTACYAAKEQGRDQVVVAPATA